MRKCKGCAVEDTPARGYLEVYLYLKPVIASGGRAFT